MDKKEWLNKLFEDQVGYLERNIPPDDIYMFAQQLIMGASYFLSRWAEWVDLEEEINGNPVSKRWIKNLTDIQINQIKEVPIKINLDLKPVDEL